MKKLISIIAAIAMLATFAVIPAMAAEITVDFASEDNLAYQQTLTAKSGKHYYVTVAKGEEYADYYALDANHQYLTDGDLETFHLASSRKNITWGTDKPGVEFGIKFSERKVIRKVEIYAQATAVKSPGGGGTQDGNGATFKVYGGADAATGTLIGEMTNTGVQTVIAGGKTVDMYVYSIEFPADSVYDSIAIDETTLKYYTLLNEIYIDGETWVDPGTEVDLVTDNILAGKKITHIKGHYYKVNDVTSTPNETQQWATDGDITTYHAGYGKVSGTTTGVAFSIDLEGKYLLDTLDLYTTADHANRSFYLYTGTEVNEANLLGTVSGDGFSYKFNANGKSAECGKLSFDFDGYTVADHLTFYYPSGYGFNYCEIVATGTSVADDYVARDFTSSDNLAYKKNNERVIGHFYDGWTPASDDLATDGDITTTKRCAGRYSGDDSGNGYYGSAFRIDLGAYYDLTELTLYTSTTTSSIFFRSEDAFTVTGSGQSSSVGGYILNSLGGQLHTNGFATVKGADAELVNVNGTEVYQYSADLSNNAQPVRYIIVHLNGGTWTYNELYVAGTPFTGDVAFAEGDFVYAEDAETSAKTVTAQVSLMNKTEAETTGNLFYGAYNEAGELVGMTKVAEVTVDAGATYSAPVTFNVSAPAGYVKAFYWADGTYVPVIADIICD